MSPNRDRIGIQLRSTLQNVCSVNGVYMSICFRHPFFFLDSGLCLQPVYYFQFTKHTTQEKSEVLN